MIVIQFNEKITGSQLQFIFYNWGGCVDGCVRESLITLTFNGETSELEHEVFL